MSSFNLQNFGSSGGGGFPGNGNSASSYGGGQSQAIESLTQTAQSVGLTVEQLAAALASSPNLKTLSADNSNSDGQRDLALSLYRSESLALYRRCMLLAGFDPGGIEETSPEYLQFAFKAWQEEGKRLQDLLGMEMSMQAPVVANISFQQQQQEAAQAQAHAKVQAQVQAQAVHNQAKALALEQRQQQQQLLLQNHLQEQQNSGLKSLLYNQQQNQQQQQQQPGSSSQQQQMYSEAVQKKLTGMQLLNNSKNSFM